MITDINKDGKPEIWVVYRVGCKGDVSPSEMKLIMYEGRDKHAMRGRTRIKYGKHQEGGEYRFDQRFSAAPKMFRDYAISFWNKNVDETFQ
ncbi:MAG: hypothetical protein EOP04_18150 [Proteobacteria bacterium]|nr:MAG: hypothetical protein EOP04_18150 [Pseudomonadota bacterium]